MKVREPGIERTENSECFRVSDSVYKVAEANKGGYGLFFQPPPEFPFPHYSIVSKRHLWGHFKTFGNEILNLLPLTRIATLIPYVT